MRINSIHIFILFSSVNNIVCSIQGEQVSKWANQIGTDLWKLGRAITRYDEIKQRYKFLNAKVGKKDPKALLAEIKDNISRMIDRKTDAIKRIQQKAEKVADAFEYNPMEPYEYYSSKWSSIYGEEPMLLPKSLNDTKHPNKYLKMKLNNDTHFYNLAVNTSHSSVHVPTNVYDREDAAAFAIQWSKALDEIFIKNYNSDPALFWQYFGSSSGIMRHYPAKRWENVREDLFDCRIRTWFIEAATCTKDVIILVDNSGSMKGMGHHIGSLTASSILDTFSNNDFINVLNYSATTNYTIGCFSDMLVQATRENIGVFKKAIELMQPEGKTDLPQALEVAFNLLKLYREKRNCSEDNTKCNQAIMIITDGVTANLSSVIMKNNYLNNGTNIPVRMFTYVVGKEVQNVDSIEWIACYNRGYHTLVQTLEQVTVSVLQYIGVIARPLVLQSATGGEHPISWTHAYVDRTYDDENDDQINEPYRLLTSAAIPCYDTKVNNMNDTRTAYLLGVAGTDVPLDEFNKMTLPYKIGVNGYSFIVSNNGYVIMHPDLRPVFEGILKDNYNSVDLTQVEQHNDNLPARVIGKTLERLRQALVDAEEGSLHNIKLSYHYDGMKRISEENFDYYYTGLPQTPFSVGIAVPSIYGFYSLEVGDEIRRNRHTGENLTSFFNGKWKVHPKWVYCKYHYLEGHEFKTPEQELLHFLGKMYDRDFKWKRQYEESKKVDKDGTHIRKKLEDHDYYCDKQLVQRLIFDARNTFKFYSEKFSLKPKELSMFLSFDPTLRFMATMSGLTRWEYISIKSNETASNKTTNNTVTSDNAPESNNETISDDINDSDNKTTSDSIIESANISLKEGTNGTSSSNSTNQKHKKVVFKEFGDINPRAINEKWYKNAVLQHQYDIESFVYSVPFESGSLEEHPLVTGTYAIFPSDGGNEAPGSVVGFQFSQTKLMETVINISTNLTNQCVTSRCGSCGKALTCYIVDNSGYIIVSFEKNDTGRFFGEIEGDILQSMLNKKIFKEITIFDYQALCKIEKDEGSGSISLITPFKYMEIFVKWMIAKMIYFIVEVNIYNILEQAFVYAEDMVTANTTEENITMYQEEPTISNKEDFYACEKKINLYVLQQKLFIKENFIGEVKNWGGRNYYVKRIPYSNLIFVAINHSIPKNDRYYFTTAPIQITKKPVFEIAEMASTLLPCQKLDLNNLPRRRLTGCYNEHPLEHEIKDCGGAAYIKINTLLLLLGLSIKFYI